MEDNSFGNIASILDTALNNTVIPEESPEMTEREKEKHERWLKRREEQESIAKKRIEEMAALRAKLKEDSARKEKSHYRRDSYGSATNDTTREEHIASRETEYQNWASFVDKLNLNSAENDCCVESQITVPLDKFVRDYSNINRFCFSFGKPIRFTFLLPDKDNPKNKYRVWKHIAENTTILEFGEQIPTKFDKVTKSRIVDATSEPKKYFSVKHYDVESNSFKSDLFLYERVENEFESLKTRLNEYFSKIVPESRKKFVDFKQFLSKKTRGSFNGKLDDAVNASISTFIKNGGTSASHQVIHLKQGANAVLFDPNAVYFLVNMSHCRAGVLNPSEAIDSGAMGFYKKDDKIGLRLPSHMAIVEFCNNKVTIVYGA